MRFGLIISCEEWFSGVPKSLSSRTSAQDQEKPQAAWVAAMAGDSGKKTIKTVPVLLP